MTQEYISQFSEEIGGRLIGKLSKESSRTESCILGALSELDERFLNLQLRTCSVAVPGTSRNNESGNRETTGNRSLNDPCPEVVFSSHHSGNSNRSDLEKSPHMVTGVQEEIPYRSLGTCQESKRMRALQVSHNFAARTPLRQLKQNRFCWHLNNWRQTVIQPISTTTSTESRNCPNLSQRQCPHLMENQINQFFGKNVTNNFETSHSTDRRRQNQLIPLTYAWWCTTNFQRYHQPQ